ncbi:MULTISPECIES: DUF4258 domain-containing protein [unclassified Aeromonas]|uniref:DUF4258 domain-containing protein n=1 Tax=unclassified Aeromonas TaxID=257493 RepID=UPI0022E7D6D2|nr:MULTISPECIES: DUF4258 domain-containing protein [unclassified Aeromonas]
MERTHHIKQRMAQRGISKRMVELALDYGTLEDQDKYVLRQKDATRLLTDIQEQLRYLKKIIDKGGVTVIVDGDVLITTYNCELHR